jgi:hypothetical protein
MCKLLKNSLIFYLLLAVLAACKIQDANRTTLSKLILEFSYVFVNGNTIKLYPNIVELNSDDSCLFYSIDVHKTGKSYMPHFRSYNQCVEPPAQSMYADPRIVVNLDTNKRILTLHSNGLLTDSALLYQDSVGKDLRWFGKLIIKKHLRAW